MKSPFPLTLVLVSSFLAFPLLATAEDKTISFGSLITLEQSESHSQAEAEAVCSATKNQIEEHLNHLISTHPSLELQNDLTVTSKIDWRIIRRNSRGPSERRYICSVMIRSQNPQIMLREASYKQKQDMRCNETFERLFSNFKTVFKTSSERKTLFRKRFVCAAHYVELLQR